MSEFITTFFNNFAANALDFILRFIGVIAVFCIGLKLARVLAKKFENAKANQNMDPTARNVLANVILWVVRIIVIVTICAILSIPTASIIAVISSLGLALGLALQGGLSNIAGGIMIVIFRPFQLGDCITTGGETGVVTDISLFYTTLTSADNRTIVVPNGALTNSQIINFSREETRRVDLTFTVAYESDIDQVRKVLLDTAAAHALVLKDPAPAVILSEHGDSALVFQLRVWSANADFWTVKFDLTENVKHAFDKAGIEIPFPQMDVHMIEKK